MDKVWKAGIASLGEQRSRSLAIAAGARVSGDEEPRVWFPSVTALAQALSDDNLSLFKAIRDKHPNSVEALAQIVGLDTVEVSRSLHVLVKFGLVELVPIGDTLAPRALFEHLSVTLC